MNEPPSLLNDLSEEAVWRLEEVCCRFEQSWRASQRPRLEDFLADAESFERQVLLRELLALDVHYRRRAGEAPTVGDYATRFPDASALWTEVVSEDGDAPRAPDANNTTNDAERTGPYPRAISLNSSQAQPDEAEPASSAGASSASRFRVRRFHAKGGLGEVFVAEDVELRREVALKQIQRDFTAHEQSRALFVLEAEITGNLEHPGIVPVYGLGTYPDGRPYYAMRFIRGQTLSEAIVHFHGQSPRRYDTLEFRKLLGRFLAVCQAVAYAHNRGVLHRDLKPGNIMLGKFGETLVVDWGLAKVLGERRGVSPPVEDAAATVPGEEALLRPSAEGAQTTVGVVGTPAYMSPEQAAGKVDELGPATDVYSLGVTLYALLTNRAPFEGPVVEVVKQVEQGSWVPPRQVNGAVPAALDAICRKAMALRPEDRYGSALALAEDVEHWLADEPVAAYAESAGARLRRWMRKRPRRVTAAVVLLLAAVVGLTVGAVLLERSNREARENLAMVEKQANYFVQEVSENLLLNEPGMQPFRENILLKVVGDYDDFLKDRPGDSHARQQRAGAERRLGELYLQSGQLDQARALEARAVEQYEGLLRDAPSDRGLRFGLARARYVVANLQMHSGAPEEGKKEVDRVIELLERLKAEEPGNTDYLIVLARSYDLRATLAVQDGDIRSALTDNKRVLEALDDAEFRTPGSLRTQRLLSHSLRRSNFQAREGGITGSWSNAWPGVLMLGRAYTNQGILLSLSGRNGEAVRILEEAIAVQQMLLEQNARAGQFRHGLALALLHCGRVKVELGLPGKAEPALREALGLMQQLIQEDSHTKEYRATRLLAAGYLGGALFRQGRSAAAAELLREVEKEGEEVFGGPGKNHGLRGQHARLLLMLGSLEGDSGNLDRGVELCLKAHQQLEQALRETPGERWLRSNRLASREALARYRFLKGALTRDRWIAEQQAILKERKGLVGQGPPSSRFSGEVAGSVVVLAGLLLEAGRPAEALACVEEVLPGCEKAVWTEQDRVKAAVKEQQEAAQVPVEAGHQDSLQSFLRATPIFPDNSLHRQRAALVARRGAALAHLGREAEAVEAVRQAIGINAGIVWGDRPFHPPPASPDALWAFLPTLLWPLESCHLYDLACHLTLASTRPGANDRPDPAEQAVRALRWCIASGFDNLHQLRTDPALEPLRKREDFRQLVRDLEARSLGRKDANFPPNVAGSTTK
jgi:tetratricopeptide (TPR) repeat protein